MPRLLARPVREDLLQRGFTRRSFGRIAALVAGGASALPFYNDPALAHLSFVGKPAKCAFLINANENPLGPCPEALWPASPAKMSVTGTEPGPGSDAGDQYCFGLSPLS